MLSMSLGMGTPLLLVGASAGALLPKAGAWMDTIKNLFGVMFLAVAAWMLSRIVPAGDRRDALGHAVAGAGLGAVARDAKTRAGAQSRCAWSPWSRPCSPSASCWPARAAARIRWSRFRNWPASSKRLEFKRIKTVADLEREVAAAKAAGKSVMLDFYADWCVSCKEMEHNTFTVPKCRTALGRQRAAAGRRHRQR